MAAGSTYTPIATTTLGSAAATYTFSSIPSTYTDLVIVIQVTDATASNRTDVQMRYNGDTGNNYSVTVMGAPTGGSTNSQRSSNISATTIGMQTNEIATIITQIQNYSNTTTYKTNLSRTNVVTVSGGAADYPVGAFVGLWRSTAAINSVTIFSGQNFTAGSTFTLYGIAKA